MLRNNRGSIATLVEILVVAVIIIGAGLWIAQNYVGKTNTDKGPAATPQNRALGVDCQNNLQQVRYAITIYQQSSEQMPPSLKDLESSGITPRMTNCSVSGKPYGYDPTQGRVWCVTPGHERY